MPKVAQGRRYIKLLKILIIFNNQQSILIKYSIIKHSIKIQNSKFKIQNYFYYFIITAGSHPSQTQKNTIFFQNIVFPCAWGGTRTRTVSPPRDFKSLAYTSFATQAFQTNKNKL